MARTRRSTLAPRETAEQIQARTLKRLVTESYAFLEPVTHPPQDGDDLAMRMLKKIHAITAKARHEHRTLTEQELRKVHSAAFAGIDGPDPEYGL